MSERVDSLWQASRTSDMFARSPTEVELSPTLPLAAAGSFSPNRMFSEQAQDPRC